MRQFVAMVKCLAKKWDGQQLYTLRALEGKRFCCGSQPAAPRMQLPLRTLHIGLSGFIVLVGGHCTQGRMAEIAEIVAYGGSHARYDLVVQS